MKVFALMSPRPVEVQRDDSLDDAILLMDRLDLRHLPVVDSSGLVGVISDSDLLDATGWLPRRERKLTSPGTVGDFMRSPPICVEHDFRLEHALGLMVERRMSSLPVMDGASLVGMLTEVNILRGYVAACQAGRIGLEDDSPVHEHMRPVRVTLPHDASCEDAVEAMRAHGLRRLPVVSGGELVGTLSDRDIRGYRGQERLGRMPVCEMMHSDPETAEPDGGLSRAAFAMGMRGISSLPVVSRTRLVGILSLVDVMISSALILMKYE